jgi:hypothetical protein
VTRDEQVFRLWRLLDDIDTLDDMCRFDDERFRDMAREVQRQRFAILSGEDFEELWRKYENPSDGMVRNA